MRIKARPCDPITNRRDIERLKKYLKNATRNGNRDSLMVTLGCNFGLRASDLCKLTVGDVQGTHLDIREQKTNKRRIVPINEKAREEINGYIAKYELEPYEYLFPSQKGGHIQPKHIHKLMKSAGRAIGLKGNIGSHTLRKTMAYHAMKNNRNNPDALANVMYMFNHTSIKTTERYLKSSAELEEIYLGLNL